MSTTTKRPRFCRATHLTCNGGRTAARVLGITDACTKSYPHYDEPHACHWGGTWVHDYRKRKATQGGRA